ncbi:S1C family serine protease [Akkermansiaceae bacterium]|nr:S1C family serine protease [Akkermansiaceae bacterium]MDA7618967.1 S1C family serine protease [bacterium]MDA7649288.1 S1C family serine protease [Akkermansiaceae bacterium]MDA7684003.1 S1C family serine protease [Akkermansiaceae bacterium]MDA7877216.1 S1C family serine protease [Akkermansiaceae bacterium]
MTRCFAFIFWLFAAVSLSFGEERPAMPWIGVMLQQPDSKKERPSEIGTGIGLLVEGVVKNGPLAKAKGQVGDLWWKLDDQILVNMRQLLVLLRMKKVGESVKIHFFREGKLNSQSLTLGSRPPRGELTQITPILANTSSTEVQTTEVAEMKDGPYYLTLSEVSGEYNLLIKNGSEVFFDGPVNHQKELEKLAPRWRSGILILRQALAARAKPKRGGKAPRVRYLPRNSEE